MPNTMPRELVGRLHCDGTAVIQSVNDTLASWLDYPPAELVGQPFDTLLEAAGRLYFHSQLIPSLGLNQHVEEVYLNFCTREGMNLPVLISACLRQGEDGEGMEFAIVRIYRRARLEDELLRAKKEAQQADTAKSRFLGMITHELRTPLQSICMSVDLLLEGSTGPLTPTQQKLLEVSQLGGGNLSLLIEDILEFTRMRSGSARVDIETVSVKEILKKSESLVAVRMDEASIKLVSEPVPAEARVFGDPKRIQQILLNLLTNALKFTPPGGSITTRLVVDGDRAQFEVEDTGCGISSEDLVRIFDAFVQAGSGPGRDKGIGLGLAISRDLAQAMKGTLQVRSTPGRGSTFSLGLPVAACAEPDRV